MWQVLADDHVKCGVKHAKTTKLARIYFLPWQDTVEPQVQRPSVLKQRLSFYLILKFLKEGNNHKPKDTSYEQRKEGQPNLVVCE
jgi:hypothetical protein